MKGTAWIDLGENCAVRASEVGYVHSGTPPAQMQFPEWIPGAVKCVIWLKNGQQMPAYEPAQTIIRRLDAAEMALAHEELSEAYRRGYNSGYVARSRKAAKATSA